VGNKIIHPYSDFSPDDVGTGDGIAQVIDPNNRQLDQRHEEQDGVRPRFGAVARRNELMHDGLNSRVTRQFSSRKRSHGVVNNYRNLTTTQKNQLIDFLNSL